MTENNAEPNPKEPTRKTYVRPKLVEYGNVRDFTRAGLGSQNEKGGGFFKQA